MKKEKKKYWIFTTQYECPICGRGENIKERMYTEKPEDYYKRYEFNIKYDYCDQ